MISDVIIRVLFQLGLMFWFVVFQYYVLEWYYLP